MYLYYLNKYQGIINNPIHHYTFNDYLPHKSGVIVENIISSDYFQLNDENAKYVSLWYLKGFEKITKKRWSAHSYLHNNFNQKTHLHFLLEPFKNFRIHKEVITNPNNVHLVINTQQLNELKNEFNMMFSTPEYDALLNELIELDDDIKQLVNRDQHYRSILSFMKSKEMYNDFDNNMKKILTLDLSHINEEQLLSLTQGKEVSDFKQKI